MKNLKLKAKIIENYETQILFSHRVGAGEAVVSRVINHNQSLPEKKKQTWAKALGCKVQDIFPG